MNPIIFKIIGMLIGIGFMALAVAWSHDPDASAATLFIWGGLLFLGSNAQITNLEENKNDES